MYTIECWPDKPFPSIDELVEEVIYKGVDPSYEVLENGIGIGELISDFIIE